MLLHVSEMPDTNSSEPVTGIGGSARFEDAQRLETQRLESTRSTWEMAGPVVMVKTVLIVEDNELNMKLFHDLLDSQGYLTLQTRHGIEALGLARTHRPDLILMDIQLPEVSGLEVTKWLKEDDELRDIPVIAVTAYAMKGDEERILEGGCEAYLSKPISLPLFLETVRRFIGED